MGGIVDDEVIYDFHFDPETQAELAEIVEYYSTHPSPDNGKRFLVKVETVVELLRLWPEAGAQVPELPTVRGFSIPKYPYRLYYTLIRQELAIIGLALYNTNQDTVALIDTLTRRQARLSTE
ncbi:MAG: type II toxin-antitoxin system RelE/ParE family toxin [Propionibacteriaceae bacterium]|jgi:plasmid stabilization system protein ParE|nr:type II toxin-antitoxin system RelE/ParE family toxin [Propionibacteriaceae bacterium]